MVRLGGSFLMGTEDADGFPQDREGPIREVDLPPFWIDPVAVTNRRFAEFVDATGHRSEAENAGWSFVFAAFLPEDFEPTRGIAAAPWWRQVFGADWRHPYGPKSNINVHDNHPVVHIVYRDAEAYAVWAGKDLPTEAEWRKAHRAAERAAQQDDAPKDGDGSIWARLRALGLPDAKARCLLELAGRQEAGLIDLESMSAHTDDEVTSALVAVPGIGLWSAQAFLLRQLHRPDVLPATDTGIRRAIGREWNLPRPPTWHQVGTTSAAWAPYRSYAAALLWRSLRPPGEPSDPKARALASASRAQAAGTSARRAPADPR